MSRTKSNSGRAVFALQTVLAWFLFCFAPGHLVLPAADWPQFLGPNRDGVYLGDDLGREMARLGSAGGLGAPRLGKGSATPPSPIGA